MSHRASFTDQQQYAVEAAGVSVVLSSGAGCGKTSVLTARYLKHLTEDGAEVSQIVAITFTERAAREMRDRIRRAIQEKLKEASSDTAARWQQHLRNLESAPIGTIHSFCGNLLRQQAVAAGLDPQFEILEEVLAANLRTQSLRDCLQDLLPQSSPAAQDLAKLIIDFGWQAVVSSLRYLCQDADLVEWKKWLGQRAEKIKEKWLGPDRERLRRDYVEYVCAADGKIAPFLSFLRAAPCSDPGTKANIQRLLNETPKLGSAADMPATAKELHELAKFGKLKAKAWHGNKEIYEQAKDLSEDYRRNLPSKLAPFLEDPGDIEPCIMAGQRFIRVAFEVAEAYQQRKKEEGFLDFQDLLVLARNLLRDNAAVRDSLRKRFRFILLDEMQDTDPVQMELILLLSTELEIETGKMFAVGDEKQSIYRFRGADVRLFRELRQRVHGRGRMELTRNFRSRRGILEFVNALCSLRMPGYEPLEAGRSDAAANPAVEFLWSAPAANVADEAAPAIRRREADAIGRRIRQMLDGDERPIWDESSRHGRAAQMEDIVLLFRSMSNVSLYEEGLRKHGIDYYIVGGRAFFAQQEIYDLHHLLRALENPADSLSLAGALRSPFCCLNDETLFFIGTAQQGDLWKGLHDEKAFQELQPDQQAAVLRARVNLANWRGLKDRLPIARLIGAIFASSGYDAAMQFEFLGDRKLANLWKLQDLARTFDRSGSFGLHDFVQRLGELVREQPREEQAATLPEKANVVKLMSIHQAKGLEFPVVIVPDLAAKTLEGRSVIAGWDRELGCLVHVPYDDPELFVDFGDKLGKMADAVADWQEDMRILYVACTRAEDVLILSAGLAEAFATGIDPRLPLPLKAPNTWMTTLSERFNLRTGECIAVDVDPNKRPKVRVVPDTPVEPLKIRREKRDVRRPFEALPALPPPTLPKLLMLPVLERMHCRPDSKQDWRTLLDADQLSQYERLVLTEAERLFREVLKSWDLREQGAWEPIVQQYAEVDMDAAETVRKWLTTFIASALYANIRTAEQVDANVEFLINIEDRSLPPCRGWIDVLLRDHQNACRIVAFHMDENTSLEEAAKQRQPFLSLQARAARTETPIELFDLNSGKSKQIEVDDVQEGWGIIKQVVVR